MEKYLVYLVFLLILGISFGVIYVYYKINKLLKNDSEFNYSKNKLESDSEQDYDNSLKELDSFYQAMILEDIKDVDILELKLIAENGVRNIFESIEIGDVSALKSVSTIIENKIKNILSSQKKLNLQEYFDDVEFTKISISNFRKEKGYYSLIFKMNLKYRHYILKNEDVVNGSKENFVDDIFEVSVAYIQDGKLLEEDVKKTGIYGVKCPKCVFNIENLESEICHNCGFIFETKDVIPYIIIDFIRL